MKPRANNLRYFQVGIDRHRARQRLGAARDRMRALKAEIATTLRPIIGDARTPDCGRWDDNRPVWDDVQRSLDLLFRDYEALGHLAMNAATVVWHIETAVLGALCRRQPPSSDPHGLFHFYMLWDATVEKLTEWKDFAQRAEDARDMAVILLDAAAALVEVAVCIVLVAEAELHQSLAALATGPPSIGPPDVSWQAAVAERQRIAA